MAWWNRPAPPQEPSAAERAAPTTYFSADQCAACGDRRTPHHTLRTGDYDLSVCVDHTACRERAQAAGLYGRTTP